MRENRRWDFFSSFIHCCFKVWCDRVLRAKTLIGCYILLNEALNTKIDRFTYLDVALVLKVLSLDLKLVCKVCELLR